MGKNPGFYFYPSDWTRDLDDQDIEIEGAWIRVCCRLWWADNRGQATKTLKEWSRILRKTEKKTMKIFQILIEKHIASGSVLDNQNVTIINRRMVRDSEISQLRREVGKLGGNPTLLKQSTNLDNQKANQKGLSSSSTSSSNTITPPNSNVLWGEDSQEYRLASLLFKKIQNRNNGHKPPNLQSWARQIDLMVRIDHRDIKEVERVIEWTQRDPFWQNNILSTEKLRGKYDVLVLKMKANYSQKEPRQGKWSEKQRPPGEIAPARNPEPHPDMTPEQIEENKRRLRQLQDSLGRPHVA